ncbi:hypothetical protein [Burkholderia multivorans]|uniref:hypothetical protein n=1 Tax=Burkholderia multivorans TaxID=87883 RepID=UPI0015889AD7|nr:hypothetical protein [Burkholderia multivorans]
MDTILSTLSASLLAFVEDQLSNDENSPDDELLDHFIANGLTEEQARQALTYRSRYLCNIYETGFTPISNPGVVLRYNPHKRDVEPE